MGYKVMAFAFALAVSLISTLTPTLCYVTPNASMHHNTRQPHGIQTYIVLVERPSAHGVNVTDESAHRLWHESFLPDLHTEHGDSRLIYSYTEVISGFAARLTEDEVAVVSKKPGFVRALPERRVQLMTTHTPRFLGLVAEEGVWKAAEYGKGVVIGLLDTGISWTHPSFGDEGMPPPPPTWSSTCQPPAQCNNKLVGARVFVRDSSGTDDNIGHGTHTSATAAGNFVAGASAFGLGAGIAAGTAPGAHLAMYKVCSDMGCYDSDVLAGMDAAVIDGVDVLSISLGGFSAPLDQDAIAIGAFGAVSNGVVVVCAGGNSGPLSSSLSNEAPWILTVAAGSVDRSFRATVQLGDGEAFKGESLTQDNRFGAEMYPLYYSRDKKYCDYFYDVNITGKVVVCDTQDPVPPASSVDAIREAGGAGAVFINSDEFGDSIILAKYRNLPLSQVTSFDGSKIVSYTSEVGESLPTATIAFGNTVVGTEPAPVVAAFSSRGPSVASPGVLKPDILAPGVNILAAWPAPLPADGTASFNIVSGTSMAAPHVSGLAALVRKVHPYWSPAAIKSAIMTTSDADDNSGLPITDERHIQASFYSIGAGHANVAKATDPGLVYDISISEYSGYICAVLGDGALQTITGEDSCAAIPLVPAAQLNYPTIVVPLRSEPSTVHRTVTNVGPARSRYVAQVDMPEWLNVVVEPPELVFEEVMERRSFTVTVSRFDSDGAQLRGEGNLRWVSDEHVVRSPIIADADIEPR